MGCLVFLVLHALKALNSDYDVYWFTLLVSLDAQVWLRIWLWRCTRR